MSDCNSLVLRVRFLREFDSCVAQATINPSIPGQSAQGAILLEKFFGGNQLKSRVLAFADPQIAIKLRWPAASCSRNSPAGCLGPASPSPALLRFGYVQHQSLLGRGGMFGQRGFFYYFSEIPFCFQRKDQSSYLAITLPGRQHQDP